MAVYKVSYVVSGSEHPGAILNQDHLPQLGERVQIGTEWVEVLEALELAPPRGAFYYYHVTCRLLSSGEPPGEQSPATPAPKA